LVPCRDQSGCAGEGERRPGCGGRRGDLWGEEVLGIVWNAHLAATGQQLPPDAFTIDYPTIDVGWDFDDHTATRALPRLSRLYLHRGGASLIRSAEHADRGRSVRCGFVEEMGDSRRG
jgi:hypothetical protein